MSTELEARPSATMFDVETLVNMAWKGHIRVPHFQRDFRWQRPDVIRLFDSITRGYPIGSLLLWRRPATQQHLQLGALSIEATASDRALWVVDGQQRITSLANALHEQGGQDSRFALAYDLRAKQFVPRPAVEDPTIIPLPVIFDLQKILRWFTTYREAVSYVEGANAVTKTLRQYAIPAYEVVQDDAQVLQDIFDRMNNYGKRLSRAEVFSALFAGDEKAKDKNPTFDRIAESLDADLGFGVVDNDTVLRAVLARRGPDVAREIRNEFGFRDESRRTHQPSRAIIEFPNEDRDTAYRLGEEALRRAIRFLQDEAGVPHFSMLPYRHLLVVLTRLFAHHQNLGVRNIRLLRRWFWRAAVVGPEIFKGSTTGALRFLCFAVKPDNLPDSIRELLKLVDRPDHPLPELRRFRSNEASTKIALCSWWSIGPRSLTDGEKIIREELSSCLIDRQTAFDAIRYVIPRHAIPKEYRLWAANRILLPSVGSETGAVEGEVRMLHQPIREAVLSSHLMPPEVFALLDKEKPLAFLKARQAIVRQQLQAFLQTMCEWGFEDTPPLTDLLIEDLDEVIDDAS